RVDEAAAVIDEWSQSPLSRMEGSDFNGGNQRAWLALQRGHPAESRRILQHGGGAPPQAALVGGYQAAIEGLSHLWEGQVAQAAQVLQRALARAEQNAGRRDVMPVTLAAPLALALTECGESRQAELVLANRLDAIEYLGGVSAVMAGYLAAARLAKLRGQEARSYELLNELELAGASRAMPRVQATALGELIRLHSLRGHPETCAGLLKRLEAVVREPLGAGGILAGPLQLMLDIARAYVRAAHAQWPAVLEALDAAAARAERLNRGGDRVEIGLLRARALHASARDYSAVLNEAVSLAETFGLERMLAEEPPAQLLHNLRPAAEPDARHPEAPGTEVPVPPHVAPTPLLTPKERDILGLLVHRLSNKQIANALDVGDATVKWHLKNVFSKLHAASRDHAVQRARMLGILDA
ncbi:MAG TPA: LuxR C-terminal-related transcriptional regulator, partial [Steroidobacteraceae bacterium]|nr:LuxR C-terminal-related transcriptional regulator [Steroidobacteraceae bacterium]